MAEPSPRDRKAALRVLQAAQVAYDLARFPKKQVLGDAADTKRLLDSIAATRAASADLSPALRDGTAVKWPELIADAGDPEAAWRIAKRVIPSLFAELRPLLGDDPEAAFLPVVEPSARKAKKGGVTARPQPPAETIDGTSHVHETFVGRSWAAERVDQAEFDECVFEGSDLSAATLAHCRFTSCRFVRCDLSNAKIPNTRLRDVRFESTKLLGVDWTKADGMADPHAKTGLAFVGCVLDLASFAGVNLRGATIEDCRAKETDFTEADLRDSTWDDSNLTGARFHNTNLERADLRRASSYEIDPRANRLKGARFALPDAVALLRGLDVVIEE
jgi:uncharacterized protein YjbI with pentapeptide repeats